MTHRENHTAENRNDTLRIGLLGCGPIAQFAHLPALAKARWVRLTAICDAAEDLLQTIGRQTGTQRLYTIYGKRGSVEVETFLPFYHRPSRVRLFSARGQCWQTPLGSHGNAYKNQLEAFATAVLDDRPTNPGVVDGLAVVRLLDAVEQSVAEDRRVEIDGSQP